MLIVFDFDSLRQMDDGLEPFEVKRLLRLEERSLLDVDETIFEHIDMM